MGRWSAISAVGLAILVGGAAPPGFWQTGTTESGAPFAIAAEDGTPPMMRFECAPDGLVGTLYGAVHLFDPETKQEVGDAPAAEVIDRAAQLALITDRVNAHWDWAEAEPNPAGGWDLVVTLPYDHPALQAFPRAEMIGLLHPGGGSASAVESSDRKRLADFVRRCREAAAGAKP